MDESHIPIDINIGKLQDWLVSRRHVSKEWQRNIIAVREKINNAIQDMPAHDGIAALLSGSYINYFHCQKIIEILKETEADTKNLFGRYGSQRMKDWLDILKTYEKENLYLGEAAQILVRYVQFEIPSLKKQIAKEEQLQLEYEKKQADHLKNEASMKSEFVAQCRQLGIQGDHIKKELVERLHELPEIYDDIGSSLKPIQPGIDLYSAFTKYILEDRAPEVLPLLQFVVNRGNVTVYEWSYGEPPTSVEPDPVHIEIEETGQGGGDKIDFGDSGEIDFGAVSTADIDFGDGDAAEIDWGIDASPAVELAGSGVLDESGVVLEAIGAGGAARGLDALSLLDHPRTRAQLIDQLLEATGAGGAARGLDALSLLDHPRTRAQLIDQLLELESFLKMRLYETNTGTEQSFSLTQQLPTESSAALAGMLAGAQAGAARLAATSHLHNVKHSPRYVDMLSEQLQQRRAACARAATAAARAAAARQAAVHRAGALRPELASLSQRTTQLQAQIEEDISKKYKGRPVNIIGGVKFL